MFHDGPVDTELHLYRWQPGADHPTPVPGNLARISEMVADPDVLVWVDVVDPDHATLLALARQVGLDPLAVEDAVAVAERPKASRHPGYAFFTAYTTDFAADPAGADHDSQLRRHRVSAFVLPAGLITIRLGGPDGLDVAELQRRWANDAALLTEGSGALAYGLIDLIVDGHFETIQALSDRVETLETDLFTGRTNADRIPAIYRLRKELLELRRVVLPMREVVNTLQRHTDARPGTPLGSYFSDVEDHVLRASEWVESLRDMITSVFEANLSLTDERLNVVMKKLAGWAAVIAVPTAVTGWFGQNVPFPGFSQPLGLALSVGLILVGTVTLYVVLRRQDWI